MTTLGLGLSSALGSAPYIKRLVSDEGNLKNPVENPVGQEASGIRNTGDKAGVSCKKASLKSISKSITVFFKGIKGFFKHSDKPSKSDTSNVKGASQVNSEENKVNNEKITINTVQETNNNDQKTCTKTKNVKAFCDGLIEVVKKGNSDGLLRVCGNQKNVEKIMAGIEQSMDGSYERNDLASVVKQLLRELSPIDCDTFEKMKADPTKLGLAPVRVFLIKFFLR